jgi:uncharacterized membrane protein
MNFQIKNASYILATLLLGWLPVSYAVAQGNGNGNGNGVGGGGSDPSYTILTFLPPGTGNSPGSYVHDINEQGQAVGYILTQDGASFIGYQLDIKTGEYTEMADGLGPISINNHGQIAGAKVDGSGFETGIFLSSATATPILFPPLPGDSFTDVRHINDNGIAIGHSTTVVSGTPVSAQPVAWRVRQLPDGTFEIDNPIVLPEFYEGGASFVYDLNETLGTSAQVVGESVDATFTSAMAVIWTLTIENDGSLSAAAPIALGTLDLNNPTSSSGRAINNPGDAGGRSDQLAFFAPAGQAVQPLPMLRRTLHSEVSDVNDSRVCVGESRVESRGFSTKDVATQWRDGEVIDLNNWLPKDSGWDRLRWATTINNNGVIGGFGDFNGKQRGFVMFLEP